MSESTSIDNLSIKITAHADGAATAIQKLIESMGRLKKVTEGLTGTNSTLKHLAKNMNEISKASKSFNVKAIKDIDKMGDSMDDAAKSSDKLNKSLQTSSKLFNFAGALRIGKSIGNVFASSISAANDYIESQNLFLVAMGDFADEATRWSTEVSDALGIDPAEMQKNMGYFQQLSTALGVSSDKAYILTKNMTSLAYDISSLYNIQIDQSFLKLQSALVGELEPIRRLGIDISKARLQQELYNLGVNASIESLSQADKALLRYLAIMKQTTNAQADMGKTLMSPANALRVLKSSFIQLARSVGYVFIPILQSMLPVIQVVTKALGILAERLAIFLGFEMPKFDTSGLGDMSQGFENVGEEIEGAQNKLKSFTTGFDELNVINDQAGIGEGIGGSILGGIELPEYDILSKYAGNLANEALPKLMEAFEKFGNSAGVQLALAILKELWNTIREFGEWALENPEAFGNLLFGIAAGLTAITTVKGVVAFGTFLIGVRDNIKKIHGWWKKLVELGVIAKLKDVLGLGGLIAGAFITINSALKLLTGKFQDFAKVAKTALLGIGSMVLVLGAIMGVGLFGVIGGLIVLFSAFAEETMFVLATLGKWIINNAVGIATYLTLAIKNFFAYVKYGADVLFISIEGIWENIKHGTAKLLLELEKESRTAINKFLNSEYMQEFVQFLDEIFGTDMSTTLSLKFDTTEVDQALRDLENLPNEVNKKIYDRSLDLTKQLGEYATEAQELHHSVMDWTDSLQFASAVKMTDKWNEQRGEDSLLGKLGVNYDFSRFGEQQLEEMKKTSESLDTQLATQERQLEEEQLANDYAELQKQISEQNLEATNSNGKTLQEIASQDNNFQTESKNFQTDIGKQLSNLWWKLDAVQRACEDIQIEVNNYYVSDGAKEYATGGLPSKGEVFIANEAGPEFVGSIGTQTAVANSDQMVAAFAQGVYQGMMAAKRDSGSQKIQVPVSVLLPNGRVLATATAEGQAANGYNMGLGGFDV